MSLRRAADVLDKFHVWIMISQELRRIVEYNDNFDTYHDRLRKMRKRKELTLSFIFLILKEYQLFIECLQRSESSFFEYEACLQKATSNAADLLLFESYAIEMKNVKRMNIFRFCF